MGRDKALVEVGGRALARIAADALRDAGAGQVFAVGGDRRALEALGLRTVPDGWPGEGPLGGLVTALAAATDDVVVVLSCDLPEIGPEAVTAVVEGLGDNDAAIPVVAGRAQHLLGAWRRSRALVPLRAAFDGGERSIWRAAGALRTFPVTLRVPAWACDADHADAWGLRPDRGVHTQQPPG
jgi:molybdopterin-guanine dinucleotide biosynthesis protein A